jgi:quercetin dioxygenase-like cupin family protein
VLVDPPERLLDEWRPGVKTAFRAGAATGATELCVLEQWCEPGTGAPMHAHPDAEEILLVVDGTAEVTVGEERAALGAGRSVVLPRASRHGFVNAGAEVLHIVAIFSAAEPTVVYEDAPTTTLEIHGDGSTFRVPRSS